MSFHTIDDLPQGWSKVETDGTVTLESEGSNKYLKFEQTAKGTDKSVEVVRRFNPTSGKVYVEAKVSSVAIESFIGIQI